MKQALLIPGTLQPHIGHTALRDTRVRERQYLESLVQARQQLPQARIFFIENSGYQPEVLTDACQLLDIDYVPAPTPASLRGKGVGEIAMLRHAIDSLADPDTTHFLKLTGRLVALNLARFWTWPGALNCDAGVNLYRRGEFADSRLFMFSRRFFPYIEAESERIDDERGHYMEHALATAIKKARRDGLRWEYLSDYPRIRGTSGSTGNVYDDSRHRSLTERLKLEVYRHLTPWSAPSGRTRGFGIR